MTQGNATFYSHFEFLIFVLSVGLDGQEDLMKVGFVAGLAADWAGFLVPFDKSKC